MKKENKKRRKFNAFDIFIILGLIGAFIIGSRILGLGTRLGVGAEPQKIQFMVEVKEASKGLFDQMKIGDTVNIALDSMDYATITAISEPEPSTFLGFDSTEGTYKFSAPEKDPKYTAYITLQADANEDDANFYVGNTVVKVGKALYVKGKGYSGRGYTVTVDTIGETK